MTAPEQWQNVMAHLEFEHGNMTADVETIIEDLMSHSDLIQWIVGDTLLKVGTSKENLDYFTKVARCSESTLRSYVTTCKVWYPDLRWQLLTDYPGVSFAMFKECNSLLNQYGMATAIETIERAGRDLMTVKELRHYIVTELKGEDDTPRYERIDDLIVTCIHCGASPVLDIEQKPAWHESNKKYRIVVYEIKETD